MVVLLFIALHCVHVIVQQIFVGDSFQQTPRIDLSNALKIDWPAVLGLAVCGTGPVLVQHVVEWIRFECLQNIVCAELLAPFLISRVINLTDSAVRPQLTMELINISADFSRSKFLARKNRINVSSVWCGLI